MKLWPSVLGKGVAHGSELGQYADVNGRGQNFTLQPTDYLIGPASGDPELCLTWPAALPPSSDGIDWQLGTVCLHHHVCMKLNLVL